MTKHNLGDERFWMKVRKGGPDECWLWTGNAPTNNGYGLYGVRTGVYKVAHRVSWEMANGPIPEGLCVLHRCDTPKCVNPAHLFLGTHADNMADMKAKGRARGPDRPGMLCPSAKLTDDQVRQIRAIPARSMTHAQIGAAFGVTRSAIGGIRSRRTWKHI